MRPSMFKKKPYQTLNTSKRISKPNQYFRIGSSDSEILDLENEEQES